MENASKALIIAGAILLSIIIISLGLVVVNNVRGQIEGQNLNKDQLAEFNKRFLSYEGTNKTGSDVNSLIQEVISSNQSQIDNAGSNFVTCNFDSLTDGSVRGVSDDVITATAAGATLPTGKSARVVPGKQYTVVIGYGTNSAVSTITITANS